MACVCGLLTQTEGAMPQPPLMQNCCHGTSAWCWFSQNRIPIFWLVVRFSCRITPQLCKTPCSEQLTTTSNPRSVICFNHCHFLFFPSDTAWLSASPLCTDTEKPTSHLQTTLGKYSSANGCNCPKGAQRKKVGIKKRKPSGSFHMVILPVVSTSLSPSQALARYPRGLRAKPPAVTEVCKVKRNPLRFPSHSFL